MIDSNDSVLIVSPHLDDEILGTGCMIKHCNEVGARVHIVFMTVSDNRSLEGTVLKEERIKEMQLATSYLNPDCSYEILFPDKDGTLDSVSKKLTVSTLDAIMSNKKPSIVLYPYPSHHQDHRYTYEVSVSSLRPAPHCTPRLKLVYEYPYIDTWAPFYFPKSSKAYLIADTTIEHKLHAFSKYESQIQREPSDLLHPSSVRALAKIRGSECGCEFAEAYYVQSMVIN